MHLLIINGISAFLCFIFSVSLCFAQKTNPLRDALQLRGAQSPGFHELAIHLKEARVVIKDTHLIKKDFPETEAFSEGELDAWLIANFAYISNYQYYLGVQGGVNSPIPVDLKNRGLVYRPKDYGRALVIPLSPQAAHTRDVGLMDVKGAGALNPKKDNHENGLASVSECLREFAMEHLVQAVFDNEGGHEHTVGTYAVIDAGFNLGSKPAGLVLRQAHVRSSEPNAFLPEGDQIRIEKILRKYGITSAVYLPELGGKVINVQGSTDGAVVDFGSYFVKPEFHGKVVRCYDRLSEKSIEALNEMTEGIGEVDSSDILMHPESPEFRKKPQKELKVPSKYWETFAEYDQKIDPLERVFSPLSRDFRNHALHKGKVVDQSFVTELIQHYLTRTKEAWAAVRCPTPDENKDPRITQHSKKRPLEEPEGSGTIKRTKVEAESSKGH